MVKMDSNAKPKHEVRTSPPNGNMDEKPKRAKKAYRTFISHDSDGNIIGRWSSFVAGPSFHPQHKIEVKDPKEIVLLKSPMDVIYENGRVVRKPVINLIPDKRTFTADGVDMVTVTLSGVPDSYDNVQVQVGANVVVVPRGEPLEISVDAPQSLFIKLKEPKLKADMLEVVASGVA